jgi:hypothetical protein
MVAITGCVDAELATHQSHVLAHVRDVGDVVAFWIARFYLYQIEVLGGESFFITSLHRIACDTVNTILYQDGDVVKSTS